MERARGFLHSFFEVWAWAWGGGEFPPGRRKLIQKKGKKKKKGPEKDISKSVANLPFSFSLKAIPRIHFQSYCKFTAFP